MDSRPSTEVNVTGTAERARDRLLMFVQHGGASDWTRITGTEPDSQKKSKSLILDMRIPKRRQVISGKNKNLESEKRSQSNIQILDCLCDKTYVRLPNGSVKRENKRTPNLIDCNRTNFSMKPQESTISWTKRADYQQFLYDSI